MSAKGSACLVPARSRAELVDLKLAHVDLDLDVLLVLGKGRRERALPFGHKAGAALDRYLRARARHRRRAPLAMTWAAGPVDQMGPGADGLEVEAA